MLNSAVLVLNRSFLPIHVTNVKRAFKMVCMGVARIVDEQYRTFDFESWKDLSVAVHEDNVGLVDRAIRVPRVVILTGYDRVPKRRVRFNRYNIYARDNNICQYCGKKFPKKQLNLDHVIPRSRGGKSTWENVVCSCLKCNRKKGGRTPKEAKMKLVRRPKKPTWTPYSDINLSGLLYDEWKPFISFVDASYWNTELEE